LPTLIKRVSQKDTLFFKCSFGFAELLVSLRRFFCSSKRNEPKKSLSDWRSQAGRPEKTTVPVFHHLRIAPSRSKKQDTVRTFSGLPSHERICHNLIY
jgi:hypothetical protein